MLQLRGTLWQSKTLCALAALAATASFAQSSVTISGNLDYAWINQAGDGANNKGNTVATNYGVSSTSVLRFIAVEDLGGGLKATAQYNFDPRKIANDATGALGRDEVFMGLSGNFGNLRLGSPNSIGLDTFGISSPLGTGIGSGYAPNSTGTGAMQVLNTRYDRSVRYDSPSLSGLTVSLQHAPGGDVATPTAVVPNNRKSTEAGLKYANGPVTLGFVNIAQAAMTNSSPANAAKTSTNVVSGQFAIGSATLYAAYIDGELLAASTTPTKVDGYRVAGKYSMGAVDLMASYQELKQKVAGTKDKISGLRADYNLSKTAAAYIGYEQWDSYALNDTRKLTSVGLRKSF